MAYLLTADDMDAVDQQKTKGNYTLTPQDMDEIDQKKTFKDVLSGMHRESSQDFIKQLSNVGKGTLAGLLKGGQGIGEFEAKGVRPVANALGIPVAQSLQESLGGTGTQQTINKLYTPEVSASPEGKISYAAGQAVPYITMPVGEGGLIAKALKSAGITEALSPAFNPDLPLKDAYAEGLKPAALAGAIGGALGIPKSLGTLLKMGGKATPEEFAANIQAVGDKPVGIGKLSRAPIVSGVEDNFLTNLPFSGMAQKDIQVGQMIDKDVSDVLNELNVIPEEKPRYRLTNDPNNPIKATLTETPVQKISSNIEENFDKNEALKTKLYIERNKIAQDIGAVTTPKLRQKVAQEELEKIENDIKLDGFTDVSKKTQRELKAAAEGKDIPFDQVNFKNNKYKEKADQARLKIKRNEERIYDRLGGALNQDMRNSLQEINNAELNRAQYIADQHYKENIAPILKNSKLRAHAQGDATRDQVIQDFVKTGAYDQPEQVDAVLKNLSPEYRKQFAHEFLTRGLRELDGTEAVRGDAVLTLYGKLGNETKRLMFSPEQIQKLDRAFKTRKLMGASLDQMSNPKTGYTHAKALVTTGAGSTALALAHALESQGIPASMAIPLATSGVGGLGRLLTNYLTSPLSRKVYQKGLDLSKLSGKSKIPATSIADALSQATQSSGQ